MVKNLVVYHSPCPDGYCSAWIANKFLKNAEFVGINYGQDNKIKEIVNERVDKDTNVYILDFSFKPEILEKFIQKSNRLVLLDHHKTAEADLRDLIQENEKTIIRFDMSKSGARLSWEYFSNGQEVPKLVQYIEDRDLWKWVLPYSKEINTALFSYETTFETLDRLDIRMQTKNDLLGLTGEGTAILKYSNKLVQSLLRNKFEVTLHGHKMFVVNTSVLQSEVAGELAKLSECGVGACFYNAEHDLIRWALRSTENGADVSEIARSMSPNGGGHRNAAGFEIRISHPVRG